MYKKILLLTKPNFDDAFVLTKAMQGMGHTVDICSERPTAKWYKWEEYDLVLSYFYPYILKDEQLDRIERGINCHISYLPYNRGAMPNILAIVDKVPAGVTIHELDTGIDTGRIIAQKEVPVYMDDTGYSLYNRLCKTMLDFTLDNLEKLIEGIYDTIENEYDSDGTIHYVRDLEKLKDLSNRFSLDELDIIMDALDIIRACSFDGKYPGAYIPFVCGTKLYIDNIKLRVDKTDKVMPTKEDYEWANREIERAREEAVRLNNKYKNEAHLNDKATPMTESDTEWSSFWTNWTNISNQIAAAETKRIDDEIMDKSEFDKISTIISAYYPDAIETNIIQSTSGFDVKVLVVTSGGTKELNFGGNSTDSVLGAILDYKRRTGVQQSDNK